MNKIIVSAVMVGFLLTGCQSKKQDENRNLPFVVKTSEVKSLRGLTKDFTGVAKSDKFSTLAFLVGGQIIKMNVSEGQAVKKGQLIAELDPIDILLEVEAYKSNYATTKSVMERNQRLLSKQAISQQDYEMAETQFTLAKANYEGAMNKLSYTKLRAPFEGIIVKKHVENYQKVNPGEGVVMLVQPSELLIWFTVPDNTFEYLRGNTEYKVEFDAFRGQYFTAKIKEMIDSSPDGTGIPVSLNITDPKFSEIRNLVKPGFSARVIMQLPETDIPANYVSVPLTSVFTDIKTKERSVWVVNQDNTVTRSKVTVEYPSDNATLVLSAGVQPGQRVISAGVNKLNEGDAVKLLN